MRPDPRQRGSVYIIVLVTVAAAVTISLTGLAVRQARAEEAVLTNHLIVARELAVSANDVALLRLDENVVRPTTGTVAELWVSSDHMRADIESVTFATDCGVRRIPESFRVLATGEHGDARARLSTTYTDAEPISPYTERVLAESDAMYYWPLDELGTEAGVVCELLHDRNGSWSTYYPPGRLSTDKGGPAPDIQSTSRILTLPVTNYMKANKSSFVVWVRFEDVSPGFTRGILYCQAPGIARIPSIDISVVTGTGLVNITLGSDDDNKTYQGYVDFDNDTWHMIGVTACVNTNLSLYFDGQLVGTGPRFDERWDSTDATNIVVGAQLNFLGLPMNELDGAVRDIAIFDNLLSASTMAELYAAGVGGPDYARYEPLSAWATD